VFLTIQNPHHQARGGEKIMEKIKIPRPRRARPDRAMIFRKKGRPRRGRNLDAALAFLPASIHAKDSFSTPRVGAFLYMSNVPDLDLDLDNLFQPAWAQGKTESANRFEKFTGNEGVKPERRYNDRPGERRGPRREGAGGGDRRGGPSRGGTRFGDRKGGFRGGERRDDRQDDRRERPEALAPLPELNVAFIPEERGVEQLARQIKVSGRAYPLFQIALLILQKAERYSVQLTAKKKADGTLQPLFVCALDDTPWTNEDEAVAHILKNHFATFYQAERTATEPPKGTYTFVAQCGMSGVILGPPNYHDYQNQLRKLHAEQFSRMPFELFKERVKIVKDEAVVKKWIEDQSFKTEYVCLNVPEPLKLATLEEVEKHFRATHKDSIIKAVETLTIAGLASRTLRCSGLQRLIHQEWDHQRHFPLPVATKLSQQFAHHGLQFFKVNKTVTHVNVARPLFLDLETTPVSENIRHIVEYINTHARCSRKKLIEALAPTPKAAASPAIAPVAATPAPAKPAPTEPAVAGEAADQPAKPAAPETTPEQTAIIVDLHWLIHQGHVLEFADGRMETAKKPLPKPVKLEKKPVEAKPAIAGEPVTGGEAVVPAETAPQTEAVATTEPTVESVAPAAPVAEVTAPVEPPVAPAPASAPESPAAGESTPAA
jgi:hypothetical protein